MTTNNKRLCQRITAEQLTGPMCELGTKRDDRLVAFAMQLWALVKVDGIEIFPMLASHYSQWERATSLDFFDLSMPQKLALIDLAESLALWWESAQIAEQPIDLLEKWLPPAFDGSGVDAELQTQLTGKPAAEIMREVRAI